MSFKEAVFTCFFKKCTTFCGRASRSELWWFYLFIFVLIAILHPNNSFAGLFEDDDLSKLKKITVDNYYNKNLIGRTNITLGEAIDRYKYFDGEWIVDKDQYGNKLIIYSSKYDIINWSIQRNAITANELIEYLSDILDDKYEMTYNLVFNAADYNFLGCQVILNNELYAVINANENIFSTIYTNNLLPFRRHQVSIQEINNNVANELFNDERYFTVKCILENNEKLLDTSYYYGHATIKARNQSNYNTENLNRIYFSIKINDIEYDDDKRSIILDTEINIYYLNNENIEKIETSNLKNVLDSGECELVQKLEQKFYFSKRNFDRDFKWNISEMEFIPLGNNDTLKCNQIFQRIDKNSGGNIDRISSIHYDVDYFTIREFYLNLDSEKNTALRNKLLLK